MIKRFFAIAILGLASHCLFAQDATPADAAEARPTKATHSVGVQANLLFKQLFSINNTAAATNPYLVKYIYRPASGRLEFQAGMGYNSETFTDNDNAKSNTKQFDFRAGIFKKFELGRKFEAGLGFDLLLGNASSKTISKSGFTSGEFSDSTFTTTSITSSSYGAGPQLNLVYKIKKQVLLGTEATWYFKMSKDKLNETTLHNRDNGFDPPVSEQTNANLSTKTNKIAFTSPVIIYLIVQF